MNINSFSLLNKTVQVTRQVMRMLGGLLQKEVTRDDPEWAAAMASPTVREKVKIMPSRRQHKKNERDCRTVAQQLVSSIPQSVLMSTSNKQMSGRSQNKGRLSPLRMPIRSGEKFKKIRNKKVCPGRRTSKKVV